MSEALEESTTVGTRLVGVKIALDPTPAQERAMVRHVGAARFAYNAALAHVKACLDQREAERSYGIETNLTTAPWHYRELWRWWRANRDDIAPWWRENSKESYNAGLTALGYGLKAFADSRRGRRGGARVNFPRFKKRGRARESYRYTTAFHVRDAYGLWLPRIGRVHTHELVRLGGRPVGMTISRSAGRWFAGLTVEREVGAVNAGSGIVGVDLGIKALAVLSTGETVPNPRPLAASLTKLRTASRAYARTEKGSAGRRRAAAKLGRIHARVANIRQDGLHKLTTRLVRQFDTIVIEDLHVAGMVKNRSLARSISDASFGELRRQIEYKADWNGRKVVVADRWYPSSKTCSGCGAVKTKLLLSERTYGCTECGLVLDRDHNAALNLAALTQAVAGGSPETLNGGGADRKTQPVGQVALKPQPRSGDSGETRTAASQGAAAMTVSDRSNP